MVTVSRSLILWAILVSLWIAVPYSQARADDSASAVNQPELVFGISAPLSGPASSLGLGMRAGIQAAFEETNRKGGVKGRRLRLIALDDGYEPRITVTNMQQLLLRDKVLAIIGNVGTPTSAAALPLAKQEKTLFYGAVTGGNFLRPSPPDRYIINYRASYANETSATVSFLVKSLNFSPQEIALITQRDSFGDSGYAGAVAALLAHGLSDEGLVPHGSFERNTRTVETGLADVLLPSPPPRALIVVGPYAPTAKIVRLLRENQIGILVDCVSFTGADALAHELMTTGNGVIVTQVVPHFQSDLPLVQECREALIQLDPPYPPGFLSLEGYAIARILVLALGRIEGVPDRENIIDALEGLGSFDIGLGVPLRLGPEEHQACHSVWVTCLQNGRCVPTDWDTLPTLLKEVRP